jgi:hypothetical protein
MVAYVSFVAITNLLLGMALAKYLSPVAVQTLSSRRSQLTAPEPTPAAPQAAAQEKAPAEMKVDDSATSAAVEATPGSAAETVPSEKPTLAALWNEFAAQLRDVSERVHYCRSAQDITLAQQAATRLKSFVREWYVQFEECLHREQPEGASQSVAPGQTLNSVEMFAAQLETTLSNIDALDYSQPVDEVLDVLDRELETLDRQRRSFAKSADGERPS